MQNRLLRGYHLPVSTTAFVCVETDLGVVFLQLPRGLWILFSYNYTVTTFKHKLNHTTHTSRLHLEVGTCLEYRLLLFLLIIDRQHLLLGVNNFGKSQLDPPTTLPGPQGITCNGPFKTAWSKTMVGYDLEVSRYSESY